MSVPASINDLSTTAASNPPAGSEPVFPQLDDHLRFGYSCIAYLRDNYLSQAASPGTITVTTTGVGIGTATPSTKLHAVGSAVQALFQDSAVFSAGSNGGSVAFAGLDSGGTNRTFSVVQGISEGSNTGGIKIQTRNSSGVLTDALTINSAQTTTAKGGLAVAGSSAPTAGAGVEITYGALASTGRVMAYDHTGGTRQPMVIDGSTVAVYTGGTQTVIVDASGNIGVGVTPLSWYQTSSAYKTLQIGVSGSIFGRNGNEILGIGSNIYATGSNAYSYALSGNYASIYTQANGAHSWSVAPSGTAGNPITFTQAMTLDANGNLGVGVVPSAWTSGKSMQVYAMGFDGATTLGGEISFNAYRSSSTGWTTMSTGSSNKLSMGGGVFTWFTGASTTAGSPITFTQSMTLDASSNLSVTGKVTAGADATAAGDLVRFGQIAAATPGRLIGVRIFNTVGASTYTPTSGTNSVIVECMGAGGAGAGYNGTAAGSNIVASAGGNSGVYAMAQFTSAFSGVTVTVGQGGTGGAGAGNNGGASSFGSLLSCPGGIGAPAPNLNTPPTVNNPDYTTNQIWTLSGGTLTKGVQNNPGHVGIMLSNSVTTYSGGGANSPLGVGGIPVQCYSSNAGHDGRGYGSGGSGAGGQGSASPVNGGAGANGVVIIYEFG